MSGNHKQNEGEGRTGILAGYAKADPRQDGNSHLVRQYLSAAVAAAILTPLLFYLQFDRVSWFAIGFTVFLVALCLLVSLGLFAQSRSDLHTRVALRHNLADRIGAFWLMACAFGPFFGWLITALPPSTGTWKWQYGARVLCAVALPIITAVPLVRYARGKIALLAMLLLIGVTALPVLSCWWVIGDLHDGLAVTNISLSRDSATGLLVCRPAGAQYDLPCDAARRATARSGAQVTWLPHTGKVLDVRKL